LILIFCPSQKLDRLIMLLTGLPGTTCSRWLRQADGFGGAR
jgi:hypothetical protein